MRAEASERPSGFTLRRARSYAEAAVLYEEARATNLDPMYIAGGKHWEWYFPKVRDDLIESQQGNGAWSDNVGEAFATAMACVILEIPYNYLPIFQR